MAKQNILRVFSIKVLVNLTAEKISATPLSANLAVILPKLDSKYNSTAAILSKYSQKTWEYSRFITEQHLALTEVWQDSVAVQVVLLVVRELAVGWQCSVAVYS